MSSSFLFCYEHFYIQNLVPFPLRASYHLTEVNFMSQYLSYRLSKRTVKITQGLCTFWMQVCALIMHRIIVTHYTEYGPVPDSGYLTVARGDGVKV